jgi:hypothetical protein
VSIGLLLLLLFGGLVVFFFLLGKLTWGTGADVIDWDPIGRSERRRALEHEDLVQQLRTLNPRRRAQGLPELSEEDVIRGFEAEPHRPPKGR